MVSAGYDAHWADELSMEQLSVTGFARITRTIRELAEELCQGRLVLTLEGGYNLRALAESVKATFDALLGSEKIDDTLGPPPYRVATPNPATLIEAVKKLHDLP
jgi:acetoin utilization deacetylase AcuC-like enzyme